MSNSLAFIIEDEYDVSIIFAQALEAAGYETEISRSGDSALARLSSIAPAVVVLDLHLPRVSGTEILQQIRADPRLAETRVIVATAHQQLADEVRDRADWVLNKPVTFGQLRDLAARLCPAAPLAERRGGHSGSDSP